MKLDMTFSMTLKILDKTTFVIRLMKLKVHMDQIYKSVSFVEKQG